MTQYTPNLGNVSPEEDKWGAINDEIIRENRYEERCENKDKTNNNSIHTKWLPLPHPSPFSSIFHSLSPLHLFPFFISSLLLPSTLSFLFVSFPADFSLLCFLVFWGLGVVDVLLFLLSHFLFNCGFFFLLPILLFCSQFSLFCFWFYCSLLNLIGIIFI